MSYTPRQRDLKRRFKSTPPEQVMHRPGARFYVTAVMGDRSVALLGPYVSHMSALANVARARALLDQSNYAEREWVAVGTASSLRTVRTVFGR